MISITEFTPMTIYYESYRKEHYLLGERKEGVHDTIAIVACREKELDLYNLENTKDPRKQREIKAFLKIHPGDAKSNWQEYIKVSRRGNNYNIIYCDESWINKYNKEMVVPLASPAQILNDCDIQVLINKLVDKKLKDLPAKMISVGIEKGLKDAKEDYELKIECMRYEYEQKQEKWIKDHEQERLDEYNLLNKAMMQNSRYEELITKLNKEVEGHDQRFNEDMVKKALKRKKKKARSFEGVGLCFKCDNCNGWHHYTEYGGRCEELL